MLSGYSASGVCKDVRWTLKTGLDIVDASHNKLAKEGNKMAKDPVKHVAYISFCPATLSLL